MARWTIQRAELGRGPGENTALILDSRFRGNDKVGWFGAAPKNNPAGHILKDMPGRLDAR